ncbi:MAG: LysR family transcriptional regulator [Pseudolabrys sp.]|nr:LysR family transcriptional regulator [Pseudolabrys sp.]MDP2296394.1 LysR family transcriptional regulator [Pseudolabrys sp.]
MTNIPTDLLRTFVAVVDMRSFTKAANSLGVTQPAVSAQIKRLQFLLGDDIFDRSSQGVSLTSHGEIVLNYARRLLSINDQIVHLGGAGPAPELVIRVGTSSDYVASILPATLASFRERWPDVRFLVRTDYFEPLARQLRAGEIDLLIALSMTPPHDARHCIARDVVWVRGQTTRFNADGRVPLVSYGPPCVYHRLVVRTLKAAGTDWEDVFIGPSLNSLKGAVAAGLGVMAINRRRAEEDGILIWADAPLPKLPDLYSGIYVREGGARAIYEQLADEIAVVVHAQSKVEGKSIDSIDSGRKKNSAA